jgi:hypothetical protein
MHKAEILDRFCDRLRSSSAQVIKHRRFYASKFLDFAGEPPWGEATVINFMRQLDSEGYSRGSQRTIYGIVKTVFDAAKSVAEEEKARLAAAADPADPIAMAQVLKMHLATPRMEWPMPKRSAPVVRDEDVEAPAASIEDMVKMIAAAREGKLEPQETAFVALSTTFGPRREDLVRIRAEDVEDGTIFIDTCKGGSKRIHRIPDEILSFVTQYPFDRRYSPNQLSWMYHRIEYKSGIEYRPGTGWHSPRRRLLTILDDYLPLPAVRLFLRWKTKSSPDMAVRYYSKELEENDRDVFAVHPFLPYWR